MAYLGVPNSLKINLPPSATGCNKPKYLTLLGPFRDCIYPITLRSSKVKKGIAIKTFINIIIQGIKKDKKI